jgi:hypothetical protein
VVRKASASAFTMANLKANYSAISGICARVVDHLAQLGPQQAVEMDLMAQRLTMDIIGSFGFAHVRARHGGFGAWGGWCREGRHLLPGCRRMLLLLLLLLLLLAPAA